MKRGYFIILILLVSITFFYDFESLTGYATYSNQDKFDNCQVNILNSEGNVVGKGLIQESADSLFISDITGKGFNNFLSYNVLASGVPLDSRKYDFSYNSESVYVDIPEFLDVACVTSDFRKDKTGTMQENVNCESHTASSCPSGCRVVVERRETGGCGGVQEVERCVSNLVCWVGDVAKNTYALNYHYPGVGGDFGVIANVQTLDRVFSLDGDVLDTKRHDVPGGGDCALYVFEKGKPTQETFEADYAGLKQGDSCLYVNPSGGFCYEEHSGTCPVKATCTGESVQKSRYGVWRIGDGCGSGKYLAGAANEGKVINVNAELVKVDEVCKPIIKQEEELCGNGNIDVGEDCDGSDLGGKTCSNVDRKYTGGVLKCNSMCKFDTRECKCEKLNPLGTIEVKGGIYNYLFMVVNDIRMVGYYKLDASVLQTSENDVAIIGDTVAKMWVHKDVFDASYDDFTEYIATKDLFDLSKHFPPKEWGSANSFVIIFETSVKRGDDGKVEVTLKSEYKKWDDTYNKPYDTKGLTIDNPDGKFIEIREIADFGKNLKQTERAIGKLLKVYIRFHDDNLPATLYGVGVNGEVGGAILVNTLVGDLVRKDDLHGIDDGELGEGDKFDIKILPKIRDSLNKKVQGAKEKYSCD